jgi:hypothetical protein
VPIPLINKEKRAENPSTEKYPDLEVRDIVPDCASNKLVNVIAGNKASKTPTALGIKRYSQGAETAPTKQLMIIPSIIIPFTFSHMPTIKPKAESVPFLSHYEQAENIFDILSSNKHSRKYIGFAFLSCQNPYKQLNSSLIREPIRYRHFGGH